MKNGAKKAQFRSWELNDQSNKNNQYVSSINLCCRKGLSELTIQLNFEIIQMIDTPLSMEVIAEESSRMVSEHLRDDSSTTELLVEAYQRIRALQAENQQLITQLAAFQQKQQVCTLERELALLMEALSERDIKIGNLQRINQKAIMDYVLVENQLAVLKAKSTPQRMCVTPIPSELNSPLNFSKINHRNEHGEAEDERVSLQCAKQLLKEQERLALERGQDNWRSHELFTFDKENLQRCMKSPEPTKILKNCFSQAEVHQLIKKVHRQEDKSQDKQKLKHYHQYCSSMQRKYSPNSICRKQPSQPSQLKKSPALVIKHPIGYASFKNQKSMMSCTQKWAETATTTGSFFTGANRLNFY